MALWGRLRWAMRAVWTMLVSTVAFALFSQEAVYDADQVKAAFLYHFGTYVRWPDDNSDDPITIAVLSQPEIAGQLASFLPGRSIQGRAVEVVAIERVDQVGDAEIVFVGRAHNGRLADVIAPLAQRPTLVVTDSADGLDHGATVNFVLVDSRVRFEISVPSADGSGLMLSSRLLAAALRVRTS